MFEQVWKGQKIFLYLFKGIFLQIKSYLLEIRKKHFIPNEKSHI